MPQLNRTTVLRGPCIIQHGGQTFWSKANVTVTIRNERFAIPTATFGEVDERFAGRMIEVGLTPSGAFNADTLAVLWPYATTPIGTGIYDASDTPTVIWSADGVKLTLPNSRVTQMPSIRLSVRETIMGAMTFTGLLKNNTDPSASGAYFTIASEDYPGNAGFDVADIKTMAYASAWGGDAPWSSFLTEAGWEISPAMDLKPDGADGIGTTDMILTGMRVTARAIPVGPTQADIMAKLSPAVALGSSVSALGANLNISASGVYFRIYNASIVEGGFDYGNDRKRLAQTEWKATRTVTDGETDPLFYVGTSAPA